MVLKKIKRKSYFDRTKKVWKLIGDSILIAGTFITETMLSQISAQVSIGALPSSELVLYTRIAMFLTIFGKLITNAFKEDTHENTIPPTDPISLD